MSIVSLLPCTLAPRWMSTGKCALKDAMPIAQKFTLMAGSAMGRMWIKIGLASQSHPNLKILHP